MRLQVITANGVEFGGRRYALGEEFEIPETMRHSRAWSGVLIHKKLVKSVEPVILGTPPPPPRAQRQQQQEKAVPPVVESTPAPSVAALDPTPPEQPSAPSSDLWTRSPWDAAEEKPAGTDAEPEGEDQAQEQPPEQETPETAEGRLARRGRYGRRDLRPKE